MINAACGQASDSYAQSAGRIDATLLLRTTLPFTSAAAFAVVLPGSINTLKNFAGYAWLQGLPMWRPPPWGVTASGYLGSGLSLGIVDLQEGTKGERERERGKEGERGGRVSGDSASEATDPPGPGMHPSHRSGSKAPREESQASGLKRDREGETESHGEREAKLGLYAHLFVALGCQDHSRLKKRL